MRVVGDVLLPAVAYGDAAGLPVETLSADAIRKKYGRIQSLIPPEHNPFYVGNWPAGTTSDDTQLSIVMTRALMDADGFDMDGVAAAHIDAYRQTPRVTGPGGKTVTRGWGGSTTHSVERLIDGTSYEASGEVDGSGNGVLMKMAPLVYWQVARQMDQETRYRHYDALTLMTHDSDVARACTRIHGDVLTALLSMSDVSQNSFHTVLGESCVRHTRGLEAAFHSLHALLQIDDVSEQTLIETYAAGKSGFRYGFFAPETLALAYGTFMSYANAEFLQAVYSAVNVGGDTDSTASIVATMVAFASRGEFMKPPDFELVHDHEKLRLLSREFGARALK